MERSPRNAAPTWFLDAALATGLVAAVFVTFQGALSYFFSQDDFAGLARAAGLLPPITGPWRVLSQQVFFDWMRGLAGLEPGPYHLVAIAGHATCAVLLYFFIRHWCGRPAAWLGALFFAIHPASYTALYWISAIGDIYARLFGLAALLLFLSGGRERWLAPVAFALSLMCKETTILLPVVAAALALHQAKDERATAPWPGLIALIAVAAGYGAIVVLGGSWGVSTSTAENAPYALSLGWHVVQNLLTYLGWSVQILMPFVQNFGDRIDPTVYGPGIAMLALTLAGLAFRPLRERGWIPALVMVTAMLLPVLGLSNHTYRYYLYAALPGFGWIVAILWDAVAARVKRRAPRSVPRSRKLEKSHASGLQWAIVCALSLMLLANSVLLVRKVETAPFGPTGRADATVDRALIAERVLAGVAAAAPYPAGSRLLFWSPSRTAPGADPHSPEEYWERNVRAAIQDGLAARVRFPAIARAEFVRHPLPPNPRDYYAVYDLDGSTRVITAQVMDSLMAGSR